MHGADSYGDAAVRIMARSAIQQGAIADQTAGDAAAALGLQRAAALAGALGRPQDALSIVHVGGTKGKGSTVAFLSAMLVAAVALPTIALPPPAATASTAQPPASLRPPPRGPPPSL